MKTEIELNDILRGVLADTCPMSSATDRASRRKHAQNTVKAADYCFDFFAAMESSQPYRTEQEAINAMAPIAVWFIGWVARQFAIMVIKALWRRWHQSSRELVSETVGRPMPPHPTTPPRTRSW